MELKERDRERATFLLKLEEQRHRATPPQKRKNKASSTGGAFGGGIAQFRQATSAGLGSHAAASSSKPSATTSKTKKACPKHLEAVRLLLAKVRDGQRASSKARAAAAD